MEQKSNKGLIVIIVICILIILGLGGYIAYDKIIEKDNEIKELKNELNKTNEKQKEIDVDSKTTNDNKTTNSTNSKTEDSIVGTYTYQKKYTNEHGNTINLNIKLVLNEDGSAIFHASDGYASDYSKGKYVINGNEIIYTSEYPDNGDETDSESYIETEKFTIVDNGLKSNYFEETVILTK